MPWRKKGDAPAASAALRLRPDGWPCTPAHTTKRPPGASAWAAAAQYASMPPLVSMLHGFF